MLEKWIFYKQLNKIKLTIILAILCILIIPGTSIASPNDACFVCHSSPENRSIEQSLYNSNPHSILECIDCHENSTSGADPGHGQFIRQLDGSNLTGPKTTKYSSDNFSLCYFCHAEEKVVGVELNYTYVMHSKHVNESPIIVNNGSIGTNFINNLSQGLNFGNFPANIHWDHLDDFGSIYANGFAYFDSNHDRVDESFQSCPACHNVHGTDKPKMTRNSLSISYGTSVDFGDYGYIGSIQYKDIANPDYICSGACHTSGDTTRYYRPEKKLFEDCLSCHRTDMTKDFNTSAFGQGVHVDINTTNGTGDVNNSDCWTCHYRKDMNKSNIYTCVNCHVQPVVPGAPFAPQITSHKPEKTIKTSCEACHELVKLDPGLNSAGQNYPDVTAHYAELPSVPTANYCDYCHGPQASSLFQAPYRNITSFYHNSSNASFPDNATCRTCHTRTDVPADPLANNNSNFHNMTTEYGDVKNDTKIANCIYCHIDHDSNFSNAPSPSHVTEGMVLDNCYLCHGTKVTGTNAQKLHDVRSFVTTGCISCHVGLNDVNISKFGRHKNLNDTGGPNNMTDDDCKTCHFGSITGDLPMIPGGANYNNTYECDDCHTSAGTGRPIPAGLIKPADLMISSFNHGKNKCISCHAPDIYHVQGTVGPLGRVENPGWELISPIDSTGCHDCHRTHNGLDEPFHAPGIDPNTTFGIQGDHSSMNSRSNLDSFSDCYSSCHSSASNPHSAYYSTNGQVPKVSNIILTSSFITINTPIDISALGSAQDRSVSLQIEAARYRIKNSTGQVSVNWINMNPLDGEFNSSLEAVNATVNTTGLPEGNYNITVSIMASGPRTDWSKPAYPLNGDWGYSLEAPLVIEQPKGFINGTVRNGSISGTGIQGVTVRTNTGYSNVTDISGFYSLRLPNGTYSLTATKDPEYYPNMTIPLITVTADLTEEQDIIMIAKPTGTISGIVTNISSG